MRRYLFGGILIGSIASTLVLASAAAMAGTGVGAVFNLGKTNKVNAQSALTGSTSSKTLQLTNSGTGAGVGISVAAGKAPITVNANAGKATNLNADELDGVDSAGFVKTAKLYRFSMTLTEGNASLFNFGPLTFDASCQDDGGAGTEASFSTQPAAGTVASGGNVDPKGSVDSSASADLSAYNAAGSFAADGAVVAAINPTFATCHFFGHVFNDAG